MQKYDINETAKLMNFTPAYVRSLIRKGLLASELEPIVPETLVKHHVITDAEVKRFMGQSRRTAHRKDGRNKFVIYMDTDERTRVLKVLTDNKLEDVAATIRAWNALKPKENTPVAKKAKNGQAV